MDWTYQAAADVIVVVHLSYVAFVVVGLLLILLGIVGHWRWTRNVWFRSLHLLAIAIVVGESLCGIPCPLTVWEHQLRELAGGSVSQGDFIATWVHSVMFFDLEPWVFTLCYSLFGLVVLATFVIAPPIRTKVAKVAD